MSKSTIVYPLGVTAVIGTTIFDIFNRTSIGSNYVLNLPNGSASLNKSGLLLDGGDKNQDNFIEYEYYIGCEQWTYTVDAICNEISSTSYGLALSMYGIASHNSFPATASFVMDTSSGNFGKVIIETCGIIVSSGNTTISFNIGDQLILQLSRRFNTLTATFTNKSTSQSTTCSYEYSYVYGTVIVTPNTSKLRLFLLGGSQTINVFKFTEDGTINVKYLGVGDSIMSGYYSGALDNRYMSLIFDNNYTEVSVNATPSDGTSDIINRFEEAITCHPQYALVATGTNDQALSIPEFTTIYTQLVELLISAGVTPICISLPPRSGDIVEQNTAIQGICENFSLLYIDIFTPLKATSGDGYAPGYGESDGIHPTQAGHAVIASTIQEVLGI